MTEFFNKILCCQLPSQHPYVVLLAVQIGSNIQIHISEAEA
jgi:hypothetical protein